MRKKPKSSTASVLAFLQHHITIHRAAFSVGRKTRYLSRRAPFARSGNERINFAFLETMAIAPQSRFILPPKEIVPCFKLSRVEPSSSEFARCIRIPRFGLFRKLLVAHELPKRRAHNTTRGRLLKKRIDKLRTKPKRGNVVEEPEASDQITRVNIDCGRQTHAGRELTNDIEVLETSGKALASRQVRNQPRTVVDGKVVNVTAAKFFMEKRSKAHIAARRIKHANGSALSVCSRLHSCAVA